MNKCFKKIVRTKEEPGKGGFWTLDPQYLKEPTASDDDEDEEDLDQDDLENELSKDLSETCIKSEVKTEPLSPGLTPEPHSEFWESSSYLQRMKSEKSAVYGSCHHSFPPDFFV